MSNALRILFTGLLAVTLTACGKSDEEKTKEKADNLVAEHNSLASELANSTPNENWSDSDLDVYEAKINRLQAVTNALDGIDGQDGVIITGGTGTQRLIDTCRDELSTARSRKHQRAESDTATAKANALIAEYNLLVHDVKQALPDESWSDSDLDAFDAKLKRMPKLREELDAIGGRSDVVITGLPSSSDMWRFINAGNALLADVREKKHGKTG